MLTAMPDKILKPKSDGVPLRHSLSFSEYNEEINI
jgi:hypothetical protein